MSTKKSNQLQSFQIRPGEGHSVDIAIMSSGAEGLRGNLDFSSVPVPDRRFACDQVGVTVSDSLVKLLFAQGQPIGDGLLSMLVINMSYESVVQMLDTIPREFSSEYEKAFGSSTDKEVTKFTQPADQTVVLAASIAMIGYSGSNGCFDLYYASPFSMQQVSIVKKLSVEPVVRIYLPSSMIFAIIKTLRKQDLKITGRKIEKL